jgi:hypothetical protein
MSHTDKDMPYWVRLNNKGALTDHDHLRLGKPITKRVYLRDEEDQPIYKDEPIFRRAISILDNSLYGGYYRYVYNDRRNEYRDEFGAYKEPIMRRAHALVNAGRGNEYVEVGIRRADVYEDRIIGYVKDYCTAGEKLPNGRWTAPRYREMPCTPEFPPGQNWWNYGTTTQRANEHDRYYTADRRAERDHLTRLTKRWNSGDDLEDWDESITLNAETASYMYW